jgi:endonuclease/exonuclease/phosphatase family metal-dependent hydrolase
MPKGCCAKRTLLTRKLYKEKIDIACIQWTHLSPSHAFKITGFESVGIDREGHEGGVLILNRSSLPSRGLTVHTNNQAEVVEADISMDGDKTLRVFNIFCPKTKELSLDILETTNTNCLVVGDFNSHSDSWGYSETDARGADVEDWKTDVKCASVKHGKRHTNILLENYENHLNP